MGLAKGACPVAPSQHPLSAIRFLFHLVEPIHFSTSCSQAPIRARSSRVQSLCMKKAQLPQTGAEPGLEEESPAFAATVEEPRKERTPRLDWSGLLRRTFALDVLACLRCGGRLKGVGVREGSRRSQSDSGAPGVAPGECAPGPCASAAPERVVLKHKPPQPAKRARPLPRPAWEGRWAGQACVCWR